MSVLQKVVVWGNKNEYYTLLMLYLLAKDFRKTRHLKYVCLHLTINFAYSAKWLIRL